MNEVNSFDHPNLVWLHEPTKWTISDPTGEFEGSGGFFQISSDAKELRMYAPSKKDFWSKTFYNPLLIKSDASALITNVPVNHEITAKIDLIFEPKSQFDQAGLLIYIDDHHWVKCGIEYCDGTSRLSVVVTNEFSDWSTQPWQSNSISLKVHKVNQSDSIVVEAAPLDSTYDFQFVRIAHLSPYSDISKRYSDLI